MAIIILFVARIHCPFKKRIHKSLDVLDLYSACFKTTNLTMGRMVLSWSYLGPVCQMSFPICKYGKALCIWDCVPLWTLDGAETQELLSGPRNSSWRHLTLSDFTFRRVDAVWLAGNPTMAEGVSLVTAQTLHITRP